MDFEINDNVTINKKKFFLEPDLKELFHKIPIKALYAGKFLGRAGKKRFIPSTDTLAEQSLLTNKKIILTEKGEWLFICGRNLWKANIKKKQGNINEGDEIFVFNEEDECLGFGRYLKGKITIENIFDIGDFLRRERGHKLNTKSRR